MTAGSRVAEARAAARRDHFDRRSGVDLATPDFLTLAASFGLGYMSIVWALGAANSSGTRPRWLQRAPIGA